MKAVVCIPTYNEIESLQAVVERTRRAAPYVDILIIDDASPDGTGQLADSLAEKDDQVFVMHRSAKNGLGRAYLDGFTWALERAYTHVCEMDADGSHQPEQLPLLIDRANKADEPDVVIGSRWTERGEVRNWPVYREVLSRGGNLYIKAWLDLPVKDATAGFRVYRTDILRKLDFDSVESKGYFFQVDMTIKLAELGAKIVEVPIIFVEREAGESKMSGNIIGEAMLRTTKMGLHKRIGQLKDFVKDIRK